MKRNRKKSSTKDRSKPSTSAKKREENDLAYYVHDRVGLMREVFSILKPKEIKAITPACVRNLSIDQLEELCLEELLGISSKRLCAVLDGAEPPSNTDSSSSSSESSSDSEDSAPTPAPAAVEDVICLDSDSNDSNVRSKKKKKNKKKKKKRKRKSTENATNSDATVETVSTEHSAKQSIQISAKSIQTPSTSNNLKNNKNNNSKITSTNAAIFDQIGGRAGELFSEKVRGKETSRAAERVGMTVLEILEVQARARAIKAQLMKDGSQPGPSTSKDNKANKPTNTQTKQEDSSDSELEIKEEKAEVVDLLSSSDDEEKPRVEELEVVMNKEPDPPPPPPAATQDKGKTKLNTKTAKPKVPVPEVTSKITNKNKTPEKTGKKQKKAKPNSEKIDESVKANKDSNILPNIQEKLPKNKNKLPETETEVPKTVSDEIKQENEDRESSPDLIILEDSDSEKNTNRNNKELDNSKSSEISDNSVHSIRKGTDTPRTTKKTKTSHSKDFTITVKQNAYRNIRRDRNNVVISFANDANASETGREGNSFFASTQKKDRDRSSDIIEQSAKKLNSTVTKIIKEKSKGKYIKSVVQKTNVKDTDTRTNTKDKQKTSNNKNKDKNKAQEKDKESDDDEITLQLSDSEKMDLLEDLNPKNMDKVSEHSESDTKSSNNDDSGSSSDETEKNDQLNVKSNQDTVQTDALNVKNENMDVNEEACNKNDSSSIEIAKTANNSKVDINVTEINTEIPKQNDDVPKDREHNASSNIKTSDIIIPKTIVNDKVNELNQPVKTIISHLRVDEIVLDAPRKETNDDIPENSEKSTSTNLTKEASGDNVNESGKNIDCNPVNNENNLNVIEIRSIGDIPILPESGNEASLPKEPTPNTKEQEICIDKEFTSEKSRKKLKKRRKKELDRKRVSCSSSDDIVESNLKDFETNELQQKTLITDENQSETDDISKKTNDIPKQIESISLPLETKDAGADKSDGRDKQSDSNVKTRDGRNKKRVSDAETIKPCAVEVETESNKITGVDPSAVTKDGGESEATAPKTSETIMETDSTEVAEQAELEEGEITDDYKRQPSEDGEITTDTESEIEAEDVVPETICISDEENCTNKNIGNENTENQDASKQTKKKKKKNLCKKCKHNKDFQKNADQNFYRNSNKLTTKESTIDRSPTNKFESNIPSPNNDTKIANDKVLVIDNISLDSETDSDSDSDTGHSNIIKIQSKNIKKDKSIPEVDENISNIDVLTPDTNPADSDTLETLEISDNSSDCYEILSKEPTTEEIEALSNKIDRIERIDVVTTEEIMQHDLSSDSHYVSYHKITKSPENKVEIQKNHDDNLECHNSDVNDTETIPDENISWKDRYIKSKKVTKVLTTSNILNALRKKNLILKKKLLESKIAKSVEEIQEIKVMVEVVPETVEIGSIEHYNTLESSTKYVDPVKELSKLDTDLKDTNLTNEPEVEKTTENETLVNTTTETPIVTKEMKKEAKQLLKMYKKLVKHNNMFKEKDPNKKKKKKKNKHGDASCSGVVTENV